MRDLRAIQVLSKFPIFERLTDDELDRIAELCRVEVYEAGAIIFEEGGAADYLYLVEEGEVVLEMELELQPYASPKQTIIEVATKGDVLGWSALVEPHILTLSAKCTERAKIIVIKGSDLLDLFDSLRHFIILVFTYVNALWLNFAKHKIVNRPYSAIGSIIQFVFYGLV